MQSPLRETILTYLSQGLAPAQISAACNCSPSYISQLMSDSEFMTQVEERQASSVAAASTIDEKLDKIELALLEKLEASIPLFLNPQHALSAWRVINGGRRRGIATAAAQATATNTTVVQLHLPAAAVDKFTLNSANQVLEAGGQTLVTLQPSSLDSLLRERGPTLKLGGSSVPPAPIIQKTDEYGFTYDAAPTTTPSS